MNSCRDTPAKRWSAEFSQQRQMADDKFLVLAAHSVDAIDASRLFLQNQGQTAFSKCKSQDYAEACPVTRMPRSTHSIQAADSAERSLDVKSNVSTTTSQITNVGHVNTDEFPQFSNKFPTLKTARKITNQETDGHEAENTAPVRRIQTTSAYTLSSNAGLFDAIRVLESSQKRDYITLEKTPVWTGAYTHDGYQDESRSSYRTARLMCNLIAAAGASFYESPMNDSRCNMARGKEESRIPYVATSLDTVQCLGLHALSLVVFGIATAQIHHSNRYHRYQDCFMLGGIITGVIVGMYVYQDLQDTILKVVPWAILTSLVTSLVIHEAWRLRADSFRLNDDTV